MNAEPIAEPAPEPADEPGIRWPVPPPEGYTVDDLFTLPGLPPHTELIDGSLVFAGPRPRFHSLVIDLLVGGLRRWAPGGLKVMREMTVVLDRRNGPEPDVSVVRADSVTGMEQTRFEAGDVALAVEVVPPIPRRVTTTPSRASTRPPASRTSGWSRWPRGISTRWCGPMSSTR
jgi:hypothetical protein